MINKKYFEEITKKLIDVLDNSNLSEKEKKDKKSKLNIRLQKMIEEKIIKNDYCSLAHEIKSYELLKKYGNIIMAKDKNSEKGPDIKLNEYKIECVCCSSGDTNINGLENYRLGEKRKYIVCDYNKMLEILLPRITQELNVKSDKFKTYIKDGIINKKEPCIIFLSLGDIAQDLFRSKYGFDFLNILLGKGHLTLKIDTEKNQVIESYYRHIENIKKQNGSLIDANFFLNKDNRHISGIIFTDAYIGDLYTKENTYLFLNPYANNKIKVKDFKDLIYWKENRNMEYIPRNRGKNV